MLSGNKKATLETRAVSLRIQTIAPRKPASSNGNQIAFQSNRDGNTEI
jgi:hypothetical protein